MQEGLRSVVTPQEGKGLPLGLGYASRKSRKGYWGSCGSDTVTLRMSSTLTVT